ncbi:tyrosine-type recombinase/integrase [Actinokineospora sp. HUAS TT18]|uniref:tyrosine-type recombinase/integrase n=1 Tax=Actinokineospora sp. HUAS TT18 TaxID=3447451 RepID=UPI003F526AA9
MAGHVQDRWYRNKKDENGKFVFTASGRPVRERTDLYGKGMRYKVKYYVDGQEKSESFPDKKLDRAKAFLAKMQTDVLTGTYLDPDAGKITLDAYTKSWRNGQSQDVNTVASVDSRLNGMIWPFFGKEIALDAITTDKVREWIAWMAATPRMRSYQFTAFGLLSAILSGAVEDRKIRTNPCKAKSIKGPKPEERRIIPWTTSRLHGVQLALPHRYKVIVPIGGGLGLRQMEIFALSPDDINRDEKIVTVQRQIKWHGQIPVFALPKGGKSREVPIGDGVLAAIDDHLDAFEPVSLTLPWDKPTGELVTARLIVTKEYDPARRYRSKWVHRVWKNYDLNEDIWRPAVATTCTPTRRDGMHAMRHFYASNLLADGVSIKEVSEFLGHSDPGYTLRIYTHLVPSSYRRARAASDKVFKPRPSPANPTAPASTSDTA